MSNSSFSQMSDDELFSYFSDFHKDVLGFRPRGAFWTREVVVDWCERESTPEAMARHQEEWAVEEQYFQGLNSQPDVVVSEDPMDKYEMMAARAGF